MARDDHSLRSRRTAEVVSADLVVTSTQRSPFRRALTANARDYT